MNIGIIVYSKTGNTLSVAERIKDSLTQRGCQVSLEHFSAETEGTHPNKIVHLTAAPDPAGYDLLIFGAPVQAFSLDPAMKHYLSEIAGQKTGSGLLLRDPAFPETVDGRKAGYKTDAAASCAKRTAGNQSRRCELVESEAGSVD